MPTAAIVSHVLNGWGGPPVPAGGAIRGVGVAPGVLRRRQRLSWRLTIIGTGRVAAPATPFTVSFSGRARIIDPDLWLVLDDPDLELLETDDWEQRRRRGE